VDPTIHPEMSSEKIDKIIKTQNIKVKEVKELK
jgi:hypothetical protein